MKEINIMKRILGLIIALVAVVSIGCSDFDTGGDIINPFSTLTDAEEVVVYAIGDTGPSGVGIVFYVTDGGLHGLEAAPVDQTSAAWSNVTTAVIGTTAFEIGTGSANTALIIAQAGHTASAALICRNYRADEEGDWFLPSKDELNLMYVNLHNQAPPVGGFADEGYLSSSEIDSLTAWLQDFAFGDQIDGSKNSSTFRVRAVRAF